MDNYITQKALHREELENHTITKKELMLKAGYSEEMSRNRTPESTELYTGKVSELTNKVGFVLNEYVKVIEKKVQDGMLENKSLTDLTKELVRLTTIFKGLAPTYKQKVTTKEADGTIKNVWTKLN